MYKKSSKILEVMDQFPAEKSVNCPKNPPSVLKVRSRMIPKQRKRVPQAYSPSSKMMP